MIKRIILFIFFINCFSLNAQVAGGNIIDTKDLLQMDLSSQIDNDRLLKNDAMPIGNMINPDYYYIGPDDILSMQVLPSIPNPKLIYVSPDGSILIPRMGVLNIKGMTLSQAKDTINKIITKNNPNAQVFITLRDTRRCLVNIKGNVFSPTIYTLPAAYQVSTAISFANRFSTKDGNTSLVYMESVLKIREKKKDNEKLFSNSGLAMSSEYWRRNVQLLRNDGTSQIIDLEKAVINNEPSLDPYIREGDVIIVPYDKEVYPVISISGAVTRPIILPFKEGDKTSELLKYGYGFADEADLDNIYLLLPISGKRIKLEVDKNNTLLSEDFQLEAGSKIIVGVKREYHQPKFGTVSIQGYIKNPGTYLIELNKTKIKEIVEQAGGFLEDAYLPLARVYRRQEINSTLIDPRKEIFETFQYSDLKSEDTTRFFIDIQYKKPIVAVDFEQLYNNNSDKDNAVLQDGDIISIPSTPGYIEVMGQVKNPGIVEFVEGKNMLWYINRAGGFAEGSEDFRARIIKGRTNAWIEGSENIIVNAGDKIYVPRVPDEPTTVRLQRYIVYVSIFTTFLGLLNFLTPFFNK
ncbi:MAG TPA: SLBB domain-containing protein [Candidatus Kapabacteria bacterium]|nr:SLBB domain-containing protein [Candidatus Kapabacteria bacterium]